MNIINKRQLLIDYAKDNGYQVNYWLGTNKLGNCTNLENKTIWINQDFKIYDLYTLTHEIGHGIINEKIKKIKRDRFYIILGEINAWIVGLYICIKYKMLSKDFFKICKRCLKNHIDQQYKLWKKR